MTDRLQEDTLAVHNQQLGCLAQISATLSQITPPLDVRSELRTIAQNQNRIAAQLSGYLTVLIEDGRRPLWRRILGR